MFRKLYKLNKTVENLFYLLSFTFNIQAINKTLISQTFFLIITNKILSYHLLQKLLLKALKMSETLFSPKSLVIDVNLCDFDEKTFFIASTI